MEQCGFIKGMNYQAVMEKVWIINFNRVFKIPLKRVLILKAYRAGEAFTHVLSSLRAHLVINHIRLNHSAQSGQTFRLISAVGCGLVINMLGV